MEDFSASHGAVTLGERVYIGEQNWMCPFAFSKPQLDLVLKATLDLGRME